MVIQSLPKSLQKLDVQTFFIQAKACVWKKKKKKISTSAMAAKYLKSNSRILPNFDFKIFFPGSIKKLTN